MLALHGCACPGVSALVCVQQSPICTGSLSPALTACMNCCRMSCTSPSRSLRESCTAAMGVLRPLVCTCTVAVDGAELVQLGRTKAWALHDGCREKTSFDSHNISCPRTLITIWYSSGCGMRYPANTTFLSRCSCLQGECRGAASAAGCRRGRARSAQQRCTVRSHADQVAHGVILPLDREGAGVGHLGVGLECGPASGGPASSAFSCRLRK